jgi:glucokinase
MILVGDVGGTRARLALFDGAKGKPVLHQTLESRAYGSLEAALRTFLGGGRKKRITRATFGIAGPVIDQRCAATNLPWTVDARVVARKLGIPQVTLLNDLVALAYGALTVPPSKIRVLHGGSAPKKKGGNLAVIAAGTGLGEAGLIWDGARHFPLATEGGHADFAARTTLEWELCAWLRSAVGPHVSWERFLSGAGFSHLYDFFRHARRMSESAENIELLAEAPDRNVAIARLGVTHKSEAAVHAVNLFARLYGAEAGNLALKTLATAGVFVAGGIAAGLVSVLARGEFIEAFLDKGRFRGLLEKIPVAVVMDTDIGLAGARYHATADA